MPKTQHNRLSPHSASKYLSKTSSRLGPGCLRAPTAWLTLFPPDRGSVRISAPSWTGTYTLMRQVEGSSIADRQQKVMHRNCADELSAPLAAHPAAGLQNPHPGCRQAAGLKILAGELQQQPCILIAGLASCMRLTTHVPHHAGQQQQVCQQHAAAAGQREQVRGCHRPAGDVCRPVVFAPAPCRLPVPNELQQRTVCRWSGWKWRT